MKKRFVKGLLFVTALAAMTPVTTFAKGNEILASTEGELEQILKALSEGEAYGTVLRAKGIIPVEGGLWKQFDLVPGEYEVREGQPDYTGRLCVIGTDLKEEELAVLFHLS